MMTGRVGKRLNRILLMVPLVMREGGSSLGELCDTLGVSRKELLEDLNLLWLCGLPDYTPADLIDFRLEGDRVFLTAADYFSRPLTLTREEALTLFVASRALIRAGIFPEKGPLASALDEVGRALSTADRDEARQIAGRIGVEIDSYSGKWWSKIEEGIEKGKNLLLEYYSYSRDTIDEREVEPQSLLWHKGNWYLLAWCHLAGDRRLFRLDRIKSLKLTDRVSGMATVTADTTPELVGEYRPGRQAHKVKLRIERKEGRRLLEEWPTAKFTDNPDGSVTADLRTRNLNWLSNYLIKYGDRFRVESPRKLRELVREKALRLKEVYD